ncbi:uncharacterized protein SPSK_06037 [Sporothrix schenckii 1099-18]|uniref:Acyl-CoA dehydrogenase n=1 Tax=Sporothrix schenckii 1099-18 TaxID=1397361 RepID=A0A0F2MHK9_SPOSC|nr:uncharacterized protein SPSK_06037 [Sporothrix schenckii 1099-18]KJR89112.1 hypothetical protein SPSK_06037 [Sporothrix schenckii 1099-18]
MEPSSSNTGFFQELPELPNQFYDDISVQRVLKLLIPADIRNEVEPEIAQLADDVLAPHIFDLITDAERNLPYLRGGGRNALGRPTSELVTGEGWRGLQAFGIERGIVAYNYTQDHAAYGAHARVLQMLRCHLWEPSGASTTCPGAMTDGATRLLQRHLALDAKTPASSETKMSETQRRVLQSAYDRLTSRDPKRAWTSGQWMTERPGGSDVSQTETTATFVGQQQQHHGQGAGDDVDADGLPLGPWSIDGFKWFSSATDAGMTILLARTQPGKGLSAFYAPMRRRRPDSAPATQVTTGSRRKQTQNNTELNGVRIQRLKDKSGTRPVPTAELELKGMRAWMIGQEGNGIREIATVLGITRVHCSIACLGLAGRGLGVAKAYSLKRTISGAAGGASRLLLYRSPLHMRTLANLTIDYHGLMLLTFYTAHIMGLDERQTPSTNKSGKHGGAGGAGSDLVHPPAPTVSPLLRALSSLHKAYVCKQSVPLLHSVCMEALGGVGYLMNTESEALNMARLFRDGTVNAIWEGTTDVLSTDLVRTLTHRKSGKESLDALEWLVKTSVVGDTVASSLLLPAWAALRTRIETTSADILLADARSILFSAAEILIAGLLSADAHSDGSTAAAAMSQRYLLTKGFLGRDSDAAKMAESDPVEQRLAIDTAIVYGPRGPNGPNVQQAAKL